MNGKNYIPLRKQSAVRAPKGELSFVFVKPDRTLWIKETNGNEYPFGGGGSTTLVISDTYENINFMRDNNELTPGVMYEITDYAMTYALPGSGGGVRAENPNSVMVKALTVNSFDTLAVDPARPHCILNYDFDDNEILYTNAVLYTSDVQSLPAGEGITIVGYGTNYIDFNVKPTNRGWLLLSSNGGSRVYDFATGEGIDWSLSEVGGNRRLTFIVFSNVLDIVANNAELEYEGQVVIATRNGWINYFHDTKRNIEARYDVQNTHVRRRYVAEYVNNAPTARNGYRGFNETMNVIQGGINGNMISQELQMNELYEDVPMLPFYDQSYDVKFHGVISDNLYFMDSNIWSCDIGQNVRNLTARGGFSFNTIKGTLQNMLTYSFNYNQIDEGCSINNIYMTSGSFQGNSLSNYSLISSSIFVDVGQHTSFSYNNFTNNSEFTNNFHQVSLTQKNTFKQCRRYNNFIKATQGNRQFNENTINRGNYYDNYASSLAIFNNNNIRVGRYTLTAYFRQNRNFAYFHSNNIDTYSHFEYNQIYDFNNNYVQGGSGSSSFGYNTPAGASAWAGNKFYDGVYQNTIYALSNNKIYGNFQNNAGPQASINSVTQNVFQKGMNGTVLQGSGSIQNCSFGDTFSGTLNYALYYLTTQCLVQGIIDTTSHTAPTTIHLKKDAPLQFFTLGVADNFGNLATTEFIW